MMVTLIIVEIVIAQNNLQFEIDIDHLTDIFIIFLFLTEFAKRAMPRAHRIVLFFIAGKFI